MAPETLIYLTEAAPKVQEFSSKPARFTNVNTLTSPMSQHQMDMAGVSKCVLWAEARVRVNQRRAAARAWARRAADDVRHRLNERRERQYRVFWMGHADAYGFD